MPAKKICPNPTKEEPIYNEFGVCIACQGGDEACHHNNLGYDDTNTLVCLTCGVKV